MRVAWVLLLLLSIGVFAPGLRSAQSADNSQVVDGIVARIEDDIITLSELRDLAAYQQLLDGHSQVTDELRSELIEQWVVNNEATAAHFPPPAETEVDRELSQIEKTFPDASTYRQRLNTVGLTADGLRAIVTRQIYLARYLDYKFRSSVQVDDSAVANYYSDHLVPELNGKGQQVPPLADVRGQIRELLIEQGVNDRAAAWFDETKARLRIELEPMEAFSVAVPAGRQ